MKGVDIIIVGNGVLGLSTALAVADEEPSAQIAIVGPSDRFLAATPASGAMLGCFGEVTKAQLSSELGRQKLDLSVRAAAMWPSWLEHINGECAIHDRIEATYGTFVLLNAKSAELDDDNYSAIRIALKSHGRASADVDPQNIPGVKPLADCRPLQALYLEDEGSIDSQRLLARLTARLALVERVQTINDRVRRLRVKSNRVQNIELESGTIVSAPKILLAAGFETQNLIETIPELSNRIPRLFPGAGTSILLKSNETTDRLSHVVRTPNRSFACGLHAVPRASGLVYIGATNHIRRSPFLAPTAYDAHFLLECAMEQIDTRLHRASISGISIGHRPVTIDTFPLIGHTSIDGLWILTGTYREGLHLSPLLARHVAREMTGKEGVLENHFKPERSPIATFSRASAIEEATRHQMAIGYEHSMRLPAGWPADFQNLVEKRFAQIYEQIASDVILPPEFLPMIIMANNPDEMIGFFREYYASMAH